MKLRTHISNYNILLSYQSPFQPDTPTGNHLLTINITNRSSSPVSPLPQSPFPIKEHKKHHPLQQESKHPNQPPNPNSTTHHRRPARSTLERARARRRRRGSGGWRETDGGESGRWRGDGGGRGVRVDRGCGRGGREDWCRGGGGGAGERGLLDGGLVGKKVGRGGLLPAGAGDDSGGDDGAGYGAGTVGDG